MSAYYNEHDTKAAAWLRELIHEGLISPGDVDERSIEDVIPTELAGYTQCHFFAGIGGWSYALRLAEWPDDKPIWTGSCPCQPFSAAGKGKGFADERHLWPAFWWLIGQCRPAIVFGEQVASKAGREWLAGVRLDLEALGYVVGAADLCAAGVGAPHIRQRLWWVANSLSAGWPEGRPVAGFGQASGSGGAGLRLADADEPGPQGWPGVPERADQRAAWASSVAVPCTDGKARRIEPGLEPLVNGVSGRVGLLRGYGNAIVPQVAAQFIGAYREAIT